MKRDIYGAVLEKKTKEQLKAIRFEVRRPGSEGPRNSCADGMCLDSTRNNSHPLTTGLQARA